MDLRCRAYVYQNMNRSVTGITIFSPIVLYSDQKPGFSSVVTYKMTDDAGNFTEALVATFYIQIIYQSLLLYKDKFNLIVYHAKSHILIYDKDMNSFNFQTTPTLDNIALSQMTSSERTTFYAETPSAYLQDIVADNVSSAQIETTYF